MLVGASLSVHSFIPAFAVAVAAAAAAARPLDIERRETNVNAYKGTSVKRRRRKENPFLGANSKVQSSHTRKFYFDFYFLSFLFFPQGHRNVATQKKYNNKEKKQKTTTKKKHNKWGPVFFVIFFSFLLFFLLGETTKRFGSQSCRIKKEERKERERERKKKKKNKIYTDCDLAGVRCSGAHERRRRSRRRRSSRSQWQQRVGWAASASAIQQQQKQQQRQQQQRGEEARLFHTGAVTDDEPKIRHCVKRHLSQTPRTPSPSPCPSLNLTPASFCELVGPPFDDADTRLEYIAIYFYFIIFFLPFSSFSCYCSCSAFLYFLLSFYISFPFDSISRVCANEAIGDERVQTSPYLFSQFCLPTGFGWMGGRTDRDAGEGGGGEGEKREERERESNCPV